MTQITMDIERKSNSQAQSERLVERVQRWYHRKGWQISDSLQEAIQVLAWYFAGCDDFEINPAVKHHNWCLGKGLLLSGPVGSSKSTLFEAFQDALPKEGSPLAFSIIETKELGEDFEKASKSAAKSGKSVISALGKKDTCYNELGLPAATIPLFGISYNLDHLIIEHFDEKPRKAGILFHSSTNKDKEQLAVYLGARNYSRLLLLCNVIPVASEIDLRPISRPRRRDMLTDDALAKAQIQAQASEQDRIRTENKLAEKFCAEVRIYYDTNSYHISNETLIYDMLVQGGAIAKKLEADTETMVRIDATKNAAAVAAGRRLAALGDRSSVSALNQVLKELEVGNARTSTTIALIEIEYQKIRLRQFVDQFEGYEQFEKYLN